ncbi:alpha/beta fold hydrolase [Ottowia caeni]|uniref:alpha/beta fold hydrolase n=1 Tax=Ottowia caeni TaxID=2870339 RepID=UPI001E3C0B86|nr:alpha/beta hydrolase [Ottowia caeni]
MEELKRTALHPRVAYSENGKGETLLFLHGIGGNRHNWDQELRYFGKAYRAVAVDLRGYGDSEALNEDFEFTDFVTDVVRVLDTLGAQRAHVVGLSMGGLVAQALYSRAPERVASLSLVACRAADEPVLPPARRDAFIRDRLDPLRAGGAEALAVSLAPKLLSSAPSAQAREQVMASLRKIRPDAYFKIMEARMQIPPMLDPASIRVPTLVVGADEDQVAPLEQMRALAAAIPGARLKEVSGAGHLINLEKPQEFQFALEDFLTTLKGQ